MKLLCKLSGVSLSLPIYKDLGFIDRDFVHPAILNPAISRKLLLLDIKELSPKDSDGLRILFANLVHKSKLVDFQVPCNPTSELVLNTFQFIRPILLWTNNLSNNNLSLLPRFSITLDSSSMSSFDKGFCNELRDFKHRIYKQDFESRRLEVLSYLEQKAKKRIAFGKSALNNESVRFIFTLASIPEEDFDFYLEYLNLPVMSLVTMPQPVVNLLDLEEYLEDFLNDSLIKTLILKLVRDKLSMLKELGLSIPSEYYELDEETLEYKPKFKASSALSFSFSIPIVDSNGATVSSNRIRTSPKPIKASFKNTQEYIKALTYWLKS